jgi:choline-sulfatase
MRNVLFILSDEHNPHVLGAAGHPLVKTPHLDRLATAGTRFRWAYSPSPICVPARAALATGRHVHEIGYWDNAQAYDGRVPSWGHRVQQAKGRCVSIGKLHYRDGADPTGFDEQILPMHIVDGVGDVLGAVRDPMPVRVKSKTLAKEIGPGDSSYQRYDRSIADAACAWLRDEAGREPDRPWVLFVGFVCPHFPLIAPPEFYRLYRPEDIPLPKPGPAAGAADHPWLAAFRRCFVQDEAFTDETRRIAIASYYGLVSFVDDNVGKVLGALEASGQAANTRVIYASDHGDNLGARGLWGKSTMFEESVGIPAIVAGPDVPRGKVSTTPVSLLDVYPTVTRSLDLPALPEERTLSGRSLFELAAAPDDPERVILAQYHAAGAATGAFMLRQAATSTSTTWACPRSSSTSRPIRRSSSTSRSRPPRSR